MGFLAKLFSAGKPKSINIEKRFRLHNRIGSGSMSKVWRATDMTSGRQVCVKVLDKVQLELLKKRFVGLKRPDEGEVAISLDHPNIVKTFEFGMTTKGEEYLVMEYIEGANLNLLAETRAQQIRGKELDVLIQAGDALAYFHSKGYIHRDICPHNMIVDGELFVKLIDFGLAVPNKPEFRKPGNRTGKVSYMAPELIRRSPTDQRIDVFSFGVTAYQTFTGQLPWESAESLQSMLQHLNQPPRDPRDFNPELDEATVEVLMRGIAADPRERFQTMKEFVLALRQLRGDTIEEEPVEE